jgi:hypothetical protein
VAIPQFGFVFVGPGIAEIGQDPIPHELPDETVKARDDARAGILIGPDHVTHVFRIEASREGGRPDEIAEQDGELPSLDSGAGRKGLRAVTLLRGVGLSGPICGVQLLDTRQQSTAWAKGQADGFQVIFGDVRQIAQPDLVLGEDVRVPSQV